MMLGMGTDTGTVENRGAEPEPKTRWLRYAPPVAALTVAFVLQVVVVTDTVGTALVEAIADTGWRWVWFLIAGLLGIAVATSLEAGAAYLMALYDRHLVARDSVWQLRLGMAIYVALSAVIIHWWLGNRGLPQVVAWVLAGMSASALWLWSRGSRWAQRQEMIAAGQIDPALPRLPMVSKVLHPIRWLSTLYLVSWEPVATTDEARARYADWRATRKFMSKGQPSWKPPQQRTLNQGRGTSPGRDTSNGTHGTAGSGSGSVPSSAGTDGQTLSANAETAGALGSTTPKARKANPTKTTKPRTARKGTSSAKRTDTELVSQILANGWTSESLNTLSAKLKVSKRRATDLRRAAQRQSDPEPEQEPEPATNPRPHLAPVPSLHRAGGSQ